MRGLFVPGFQVWRATTAADGQGGHTKTFAKVADIVGRLTPLRGSEQVLAAREREVIAYRFACPSSVDLRAGDQLRYLSRVLDVDSTPVTSTGLRMEAVCLERR